MQDDAVRSLLLVRNGVEHDARVLRAARVAERALGGPALVLGAATASAPAGDTTIEGVRVRRLSSRVPLPLPTRARRTLAGLAFALRALRVARRTRPRLVHCNDWNTMWGGLAIKLACRARLVYDSHELWADRNGRWEWRPWLLASEALFVRVADEVLTPSPGYARALAARYRVRPPTVIRNIPEWPQTTELCEPPQPPLAIYVGGLMPGRGLEQAIDAIALAPEVRLRAVGPGSPSYRASLLQRAQRAGIADRVELASAVPPAAVAATLDRATVGLCLIQPICRSYELTLPNKLFEYAAAGLPVLASDLPVISTAVREGGLGEVVPWDDPDRIAAGLLALAEPSRWQTAARRSRAFARANDWDWESRVLAGAYARAISV